MKTLHLFFLLQLFSIGLSGQATVSPDYVAHYEFSSPSDTTILTMAPPDDFILLAYKDESRFMASNFHFNDSMGYEFSLENPEINNPTSQEEVDEMVDKFMGALSQWEKTVRSRYIVSKILDKGIVKNQLYPAFPPQHMEFPFLNQWSISNISDTISGLYCQQATIHYGGRDYTAWYAPEIPISDGPYVFNGLPGLIVKITDSRGWYNFQLKSFDQSPSAHYWNTYFFNTLSEVISRNSYVKQTKKYREDPRMFGVIDESEESILRMKNKYAKHYYLLIEQF
jgi:GLPGLI family protein